MVMKLSETNSLVEKIKIHRPMFGGQFDKAGMEKLKLEWFRILEPYDYEDVDNKLEEYLRNTDNFGRFPDAYYLIKYLVKSKDKLKENDFYTICSLCGKKIKNSQFNNHFNRCSSIEYIYEQYEKCLGKKIDESKRREMFEMPEDTFDKLYKTVLKKILPLKKNVIEIACIRKILFNEEMNLSNALEEIKNNIGVI